MNHPYRQFVRLLLRQPLASVQDFQRGAGASGVPLHHEKEAAPGPAGHRGRPGYTDRVGEIQFWKLLSFYKAFCKEFGQNPRNFKKGAGVDGF